MSEKERLLKIQSLIIEVLRDLMRSRIVHTDAAISSAIARIGAFCDRDRAYVFTVQNERTSNTHEWCADGIISHIGNLQDMPVSMFGEVAEKLYKGEIFHVPDMDDLPLDSEARLIFEAQGIKSIVMVPMMEDGKLRGLVGFDAVHRTHAFMPDELDLLQSVADVISTAIMRRDRKVRETRAQDELEAERTFLSTILDTSPMGIAVVDQAGIVQYANASVSSIAGVPLDQIIGRHHIDPRWNNRTEEGRLVDTETGLFTKALMTGQMTDPVIRNVGSSDAPKFIRVQAVPVAGGKAGTARVVFTMLDITRLVEAQRDQRLALDEARRANAAKSTFLARMSHELRTPLNGVIGVADLLELEIDDDQHRRMVGMMRESGALLLDIINDLLDLSKIDAEMVVLRRRRIDLAEIAERASATHRLRADKKGIDFKLTIAGRENASRVGDDKRIAQILHNVLGNAVKFTPSGSIAVQIDCTDKERVTISITDTGIGISEADIGTVFEEFVQADLEAIYAHGGTGLGLPISKRLAEMMGGSIAVESTLGAGSTFTIELGLRAPREINQDLLGGVDRSAEKMSIDLSGKRILLADDSPTNRMIMRSMLERFSAAVTAVEDGAQALDAWAQDDFDIVVLDISMPVLTGIEAMKAITASAKGSGRRLPTFIAFTAHAMEHQVESYLEAGFEEVVTKPVTISSLEESLRNMGYPERRRSRA